MKSEKRWIKSILTSIIVILNLNNSLYLDKCSKNPICLFDFTFRAKTLDYLLNKIGKPVGIFENYFGEKFINFSNSKEPDRYFLLPDEKYY